MRVVFIGTGEIGLPVLQMLLSSSEYELLAVLTQPDKPAGRDQQITAPPIKRAVWDDRVHLFQPVKIKDATAVAQLRALNPDTILVMAYGQLLPRTVLEIPRLACLNLHASLLPRWRGAAPIQPAIVAGDAETGITVMYMDEGLDTGDILLQSKIAIRPDETGGTLHDRLAQIAPNALREALAQLRHGSAPRIRQDSTLATYAPKLGRKDGRIDWNHDGQAIERKIRAFNPWPGAFTTVCDSKRQRERCLKIHHAKLLDGTSEPPGTFLRGGDCDLLVATGRGTLALVEVQLDGSRRMSGAEVLRGHPWLAK